MAFSAGITSFLEGVKSCSTRLWEAVQSISEIGQAFLLDVGEQAKAAPAAVQAEVQAYVEDIKATPKALQDCLSGIPASVTASVRAARALENGQQPEEPWNRIESADSQLTLFRHHSNRLSDLAQAVLVYLAYRGHNSIWKVLATIYKEFCKLPMGSRLKLLLFAGLVRLFFNFRTRAQVAADKLVDAVPLADDDLQMQGETGIGFHQGSRKHMEDRALVVDEIEPGVRLLAAIDGHGGEEAAEFVASNLATVVRQASPWPFHSRLEVQQRFRWLFWELDRLLLEVLRAKGESGSAGLTSGCVLCVALQRGSRLFFGNVGDCKIICEPAEGSPYLLTGDPNMHHPDFPAERWRLEKLDVKVSADKTVYGLAVSRTLGDFWGSTWTKPLGLSIEPYVTCVSLEGTMTLLVTTDGLETAEANACVTIRQKLRKGESPEDAAIALAKETGCKELSDNVGIVVVMLKRPEPLKRSSDRPNRFAARGAFKLDFSAAEKKPEDDASTAQASTNGGEGDKKAEL